jgi:hypothetical protein
MLGGITRESSTDINRSAAIPITIANPFASVDVDPNEPQYVSPLSSPRPYKRPLCKIRWNNQWQAHHCLQQRAQSSTILLAPIVLNWRWCRETNLDVVHLAVSISPGFSHYELSWRPSIRNSKVPPSGRSFPITPLIKLPTQSSNADFSGDILPSSIPDLETKSLIKVIRYQRCWAEPTERFESDWLREFESIPTS